LKGLPSRVAGHRAAPHHDRAEVPIALTAGQSRRSLEKPLSGGGKFLRRRSVPLPLDRQRIIPHRCKSHCFEFEPRAFSCERLLLLTRDLRTSDSVSSQGPEQRRSSTHSTELPSHQRRLRMHQPENHEMTRKIIVSRNQFWVW